MPSSIRPLCWSLVVVLGALACKDRGPGPVAPESPEVGLEANPDKNTADATGTTDKNQPVSPDRGSNPSSLPDKYYFGLSDCQKLNRYYDLQTASCTELALADFPCDLTVLLSDQSATLSSSQKTVLKDYVERNLSGFSLYACTVQDSKPFLHFYKVELDKIRVNNVKITGP